METHVLNLSKRESQIAEFMAWGATKKDIANKLFISIRTVENTARHIYEKTGITKVNELSAWWFCHRFNISMDLSPMKRGILAGLFLLLITFEMFTSEDYAMRGRRSKSQNRTEIRAGRGRRSETEADLLLFTEI